MQLFLPVNISLWAESRLQVAQPSKYTAEERIQVVFSFLPPNWSQYK